MIRLFNGVVLNPGDPYRQTARSSPGPCEGCGTAGPRVVDHCHAHGLIRGELCRKCNCGGMAARRFAVYALRCARCAEILKAAAAPG